MSTWTADQLERLGRSEEVHLSSVRRDGTERKPVTTWVVRHGDDLYVRSVRGRDGQWFRGVQERHEGWVDGGGVKQGVRFVAADPGAEKEVDDAYRAKYRRYNGPILNSVLTPEARSATLKLVPRPSG